MNLWHWFGCLVRMPLKGSTTPTLVSHLWRGIDEEGNPQDRYSNDNKSDRICIHCGRIQLTASKRKLREAKAKAKAQRRMGEIRKDLCDVPDFVEDPGELLALLEKVPPRTRKR